MLALKRVYDKAAPEDGVRFLVERLWPRGIKKTDLRLDAWLKDVAPSAAASPVVLARPQKVDRVPKTLFCRVGQPSGGVRPDSQRRTSWPRHTRLQFARYGT